MLKAKSVAYLSRSLSYLGVVLLLLWILFPIWLAFVLSIKHPLDFFTPKMLPFLQFQPTLDHWQDEWRNFDDPAGLGHGLTNSLIVGIVSSSAGLSLGGLAAFGLLLRRRRHPLNRVLVVLFLLPRMVPSVIVALPFATLMGWLGLTDTLLALIIAHTTLALPLTIFILYSAMLELPAELLDAAQVDGCGWLLALRLVIVPLLLPAIIATGILCFAQSWNEFLYALVNVQQQAQTAPLAIASLITKDGIEFEYVGSHLLLVTLPPVLLAFLTRRYIVRGLSLGTLKDDK